MPSTVRETHISLEVKDRLNLSKTQELKEQGAEWRSQNILRSIISWWTGDPVGGDSLGERHGFSCSSLCLWNSALCPAQRSSGDD